MLNPATDTDAALFVKSRYPDTRYMGSKQRLVPFIHEVLSSLEFDSALDAMSGSGVVGYLMKAMGKTVTANDYLEFCYQMARAGIENGEWTLTPDDVDELCTPTQSADDFIQRTFGGLYYQPHDNAFLDSTRHNIDLLAPEKQSIALSALSRACLKSRARGVFTYTGFRYDDGRRDLKVSLEQSFREAVDVWNNAVFDNGRRNRAINTPVHMLQLDEVDLVYMDPPYVSPHSDNEYTRRYHFVEGLMSYWRGIEIQTETKTKKFRNRPSPFSSRRTVHKAFDALFGQFPDSTLVVSYSSSAIPSKAEMIEILGGHRPTVEVFERSHSYTFGTHSHKVGNANNRVEEYLFVAQHKGA